MSDLSWELTGNTTVFKGELSRITITNTLEIELKKLFFNKNIIVDLKFIDKVDSAGLAWILTLVENAKNSNNEISLHNIPDDLLKLAKLSAVDFFLPTKI